MPPQFSRAVVVCPKALENVPVEGVVVIQGQGMEELKEGQRQYQVCWFADLKRGHREDLVDPDELGVLQREGQGDSCGLGLTGAGESTLLASSHVV